MNNYKILTYQELKALVPATPRGKMTAKELKGKKVLFSEQVKDAEIIIYANGYLTYTKRDDNSNLYTTVYSVHRCSKIVFQVGYSKEEYVDAWDSSALADEVSFRMIDGQLNKFHIINEKHYLNSPWWMPISIVCEERMCHNQSRREDYKSKFSLDGSHEDDEGEGSAENWNPALAGPDTCEEWLEKQVVEKEKEENHMKLMEGMRSLSDIQRHTIELYYSTPGITESELAKTLGVNQSTVHRNLQAGLKNLKRFF